MRKERIIELLFGLWKWLGGSYSAVVMASRERTKETLGEKFDEYEADYAPRDDALAFAAESTHESEAKGLHHLEELARELQKLVVREDLESIRADLRRAEEAHDDGKVDELLARSHALSARLQKLWQASPVV